LWETTRIGTEKGTSVGGEWSRKEEIVLNEDE